MWTTTLTISDTKQTPENKKAVKLKHRKDRELLVEVGLFTLSGKMKIKMSSDNTAVYTCEFKELISNLKKSMKRVNIISEHIGIIDPETAFINIEKSIFEDSVTSRFL